MKVKDPRINKSGTQGPLETLKDHHHHGHHQPYSILTTFKREVANTVACSIVSTRIDYCNSLFYGASEKHLHKLQSLQNVLVCIVTNTCHRDYHFVDLLCVLHWLPIRCRITFKVATLCRALNDGQPTYLASKLKPYRPDHYDPLTGNCSKNCLAEQRPALVDSRALRLESGT